MYYVSTIGECMLNILNSITTAFTFVDVIQSLGGIVSISRFTKFRMATYTPAYLLTWHLSALEGIDMHSDNCMPVTDYRNFRRAVCV